MRTIQPFEIGLMFWATGNAEQDIAYVRGFGLNAGQLGVPGELNLDGFAENWESAIEKHPDFAITTAVCSYVGEDYADIAAVRSTVGIVPHAKRAERVARTITVADIAASLGIRSVACHIGFVPEKDDAEEYESLCSAVRDICDHLLKNDQTFTLETGQEPAQALLTFMQDTGRTNLKINFDPANLILYGMGDPVAALRVLGKHVISVHCKDGVSPAKDKPGSLGLEQPLGSGEVDFKAFLTVLRQVGYKGILSIEREEQDVQRKNADIRHAVNFLRALSSGNAL